MNRDWSKRIRMCADLVSVVQTELRALTHSLTHSLLAAVVAE